MSSTDGNPFRIPELRRRPVLPPSGLTETERNDWYAERERINAEIAAKWWDFRGQINAACYAARKGSA